MPIYASYISNSSLLAVKALSMKCVKSILSGQRCFVQVAHDDDDDHDDGGVVNCGGGDDDDDTPSSGRQAVAALLRSPTLFLSFQLLPPSPLIGQSSCPACHHAPATLSTIFTFFSGSTFETPHTEDSILKPDCFGL